MRLGEAIGYDENGGSIRLDAWSHRYLDMDHIRRYHIQESTELDTYLHGESLTSNLDD